MICVSLYCLRSQSCGFEVGPALIPLSYQFSQGQVAHVLAAAQIQRRGREVMNALTRDQFLELIAVAALANTVCRLGFLTDAAS